MIGPGGSFGHVSVHVGGGSQVWCHTYADHSPILGVRVATTTLSLQLAGSQVGPEAVQFARELRCQVERFAAEVERINAEQTAADKAA